MGNYDGSHLTKSSRKSKSLIQTSCNLLSHCIQVSAARERVAASILRGEREISEDQKMDTPFDIVGDSLYIDAEDESSTARAYIVENSRSVIIAFRGSGVKNADGSTDVGRTMDSAVTDLRISLESNRLFPGKVHEGFCSDYFQLREQIFERLNSANLRKKTLYVTGFSLGAALGMLCAYDLKQNFEIKGAYVIKNGTKTPQDVDPQVFLFAPPSVGNHEFTRRAQNNIPNIFRFAHEHDVIAQIPHGLFCEYKATGEKLLVFNDDGKQLHHSKIDLSIKPKKIVASSAIAPLIATKLRLKLIATITGYKVVKTFAKYHTPEYYKKKLIRLHLNYGTNINSNSSLAQGADKQYQKCQQHCLNILK